MKDAFRLFSFGFFCVGWKLKILYTIPTVTSYSPPEMKAAAGIVKIGIGKSNSNRKTDGKVWRKGKSVLYSAAKHQCFGRTFLVGRKSQSDIASQS